MKILCDVSGSMYRFNGYDGRLEREMEAMVMVMEGLEGYEHKIKVFLKVSKEFYLSRFWKIKNSRLHMGIHFQYDIIGHSGEGCNFEIVKAGTPPKNNKDRLDAVKVSVAN